MVSSDPFCWRGGGGNSGKFGTVFSVHGLTSTSLYIDGS